MALNSTEHVRVSLAHLPRDLDWPAVERAMEESCGLEGKEQVYKALNGQLYNMDLDLQREAKHLITMLTEKVPDLDPPHPPLVFLLGINATCLCRCCPSCGGTSSTSACLQTPSTTMT